jgi:hypothetical protein
LEEIGYLVKRFATRMVGKLYAWFVSLLIPYTPVIAAQSIANIVKSSLGPLGLDKMLVDNIGVKKCFMIC